MTTTTQDSYDCPSPGCGFSRVSLADLFQHLDRKHKVRGRFYVVDRDEAKIYVTDRTGVRIGELKGLETPEPERMELEVPA